MLARQSPSGSHMPMGEHGLRPSNQWIFGDSGFAAAVWAAKLEPSIVVTVSPQAFPADDPTVCPETRGKLPLTGGRRFAPWLACVTDMRGQRRKLFVEEIALTGDCNAESHGIVWPVAGAFSGHRHHLVLCERNIADRHALFDFRRDGKARHGQPSG
ncbi:MAG: hypothetical protein WAN51_07325 [Alphaproteobacteria bacterium]